MMLGLCFAAVSIVACLPQATSQSLSNVLHSTYGNNAPQSIDLGALPSNTVGQSSMNLGSARHPSSSGAQGYCSQVESQTLFQKCTMAFGVAHMRYFDILASHNYCNVHYFDCRQVDTLVRCANSQPTTVISNRCWPAVPAVLTRTFHQYRIPCTYEEVYQKCKSTSSELIPVSQRQQSGRGMDNNPMNTIMPIIRRYAMPYIMLGMMNGGLFGM